MKVCVLLSSYNGEKYLKEQIESIINQKGVEVDLYIRDDGSTDSTIQIVKDYQKEHPNVFLEEGTNLGPGNAFMEMLYNSKDYEYYAFSDQDDVWLKNKLAVAVDKLQGYNIPCLYACNQYITDTNGKVMGKHFHKKLNVDLRHNLVVNKLYGCTMVFNKRLRDILVAKEVRPPKEIINLKYHDTWVGLVASSVGKVIYDKNAYILYRQHNYNVSGAKKEITIWDSIRTYAQSFFKSGSYKNQRQLSRQLLKSLKKYKLSKEVYYVLKRFDGLNTFKGRLAFCMDGKFIKSISDSAKYIRLKVLLGGW